MLINVFQKHFFGIIISGATPTLYWCKSGSNSRNKVKSGSNSRNKVKSVSVPLLHCVPLATQQRGIRYCMKQYISLSLSLITLVVVIHVAKVVVGN